MISFADRKIANIYFWAMRSPQTSWGPGKLFPLSPPLTNLVKVYEQNDKDSIIIVDVIAFASGVRKLYYCRKTVIQNANFSGDNVTFEEIWTKIKHLRAELKFRAPIIPFVGNLQKIANSCPGFFSNPRWRWSNRLDSNTSTLAVLTRERRCHTA